MLYSVTEDVSINPASRIKLKLIVEREKATKISGFLTVDKIYKNWWIKHNTYVHILLSLLGSSTSGLCLGPTKNDHYTVLR